MLLFEPIYDQLIQKLIEHKGVSTSELHKYINKDYEISLPNFYKVIGKLIENQILIKENAKLSLHSRRVIGFLDTADALKKAYLSENTSIAQIKEGQSMYYEATSIEAIDGVWGDWMIAINKIYGKKEATYVYQARPYYALGMNKTEMAFFKEANKVSEVYFLTGNENFLDRYGANLYTEIGVKSLASQTVPFLKDGYCVTVIGDYVFEVLYHKEINNYFKIFFDTIQDIKDFNPELFYNIFKMKAKCKLTLRRDAKQAKKVKSVFEKEFAEDE